MEHAQNLRLQSWTATRNQVLENRVNVYILPGNISVYVLISSLFQCCVFVVFFFIKKREKTEERRLIKLQ